MQHLAGFEITVEDRRTVLRRHRVHSVQHLPVLPTGNVEYEDVVIVGLAQDQPLESTLLP